MNREEYLRQFKKSLLHMNATEKEDAIRYYEEYFDEAGVENEQKVIEELGNPIHLARKISAECALKDINEIRIGTSEVVEKETYTSSVLQESRERKSKKGIWSNLAVIIMAICSFPVLLPVSIVITVFAFVLVLLVAIFLFVLVIVGGAFSVAGVVGVIGGIIGVFVHFFSGLTAVGIGMIIAGAGILLFVAGKWLAKGAVEVIVALGQRKTSRM